MSASFDPVKGYIFDLDGVIVDTRPYHLKAWQHIAFELGVEIDGARNEVLRGLSRMKSLEKILEWGNLFLTEAEKLYFSDLKNNKYIELVGKMTPSEVLPGVSAFLQLVKSDGYATALVSSSSNAKTVIHSVQLDHFFDTIIDGNVNKKSKPAPDCFLLAAAQLGISPAQCVVFEDAPIGVQAARIGGFITVAVGMHRQLCSADAAIEGFENLTFHRLEQLLQPEFQRHFSISV